jgi:Prealbumin-like fold domain
MRSSGVRGEGGLSFSDRTRRFFTAKRTWGVLAAAALLGTGMVMPAASFADSASGCDFAPNGTTASCVGPLTGSTFAGGDGNLLTSPTTFGTSDWQNLNTAGLVNVGIDQPSGTGDNSFGQGTKEDNPAVTVVSGSIPPNKSDLTRFYESSETVSGQTFLYLAWERTNVLGNANMDFEIDQKATTGFTGSFTGPITLNRSPGDMLVTYDFTNGGGRPVIGLDRWLVSATNPVVPGFATNTCLSSNTFPCWGDNVNTQAGTLSAQAAEGAVNNVDSVTDPIQQPSASLPASTFGEAALNLTAAGVFGTNTCSTFATTFLKSRSSSSFTSEVKDFVAPVPTQISNCGSVTIIKHTDPRGINQNFSYTSNLAGGQLTCTQSTPTSFTLNDNGNTSSDSSGNTQSCTNVPVGSYTVTEGAEPTGFTLESLKCTPGGQQDAGNPAQADITVTADSNVTCVFTNQQQLGALQINKVSSKTSKPLAGATFSITGPNNYSNSVTTDASGSICVGNLPFGTYTVTETAAPKGYVIDDSTSHSEVVNTNSTCSTPSVTDTFSDTPVSDIQVNFKDGGSGATSATISCDNTTGSSDTTTAVGWDKTLTVTGVHVSGLTTITCTIVIDP